MTDVGWQVLLAQARSGDADAINRVWQSMRSYLLLIAQQGLGENLAAKVDPSDIVQGSLLEAQRDFSRFSGESEEELKAWLRRLVQHNLIDCSRRFQGAQSRDVHRERAFNGSTELRMIDRRQPTASAMVLRQETQQELRQAVARLSRDQQVVIEMRHRQGLGYGEISQRLGITEEAARKRWARAIYQLRKEMGQSGRSST